MFIPITFCLVRLRYPIWLAENKSKISADQYANYTSQFELMKKMCGGVNMPISHRFHYAGITTPGSLRFLMHVAVVC